MVGSLIGLRYRKAADGDKEKLKKARQYGRLVATVAVILLLALLMYVKVGTLLVKSLSLEGGVSIIVPLGISIIRFRLLAMCWIAIGARSSMKRTISSFYFLRVISQRCCRGQL